MKAIAKTRPAPGIDLIDAPEPSAGYGEVKIKLKAASVCGTDLHIYSWDPWAASRIDPPRIIGHEFCGIVTEIGEGVTTHKVGDFVSSESHITCGKCRQCLANQRHVCVNTKILGVDVDGGFATFVSIPAENAILTDIKIPPHIAAFQDALGNAVHTATAGPIKDQVILITGMGPIGLFAATVCKALGAGLVIATEISPYRIQLAKEVGVDVVLNPEQDDPIGWIKENLVEGIDGTLEMSGHPHSLTLAIEATRPGGRISLLGVYPESNVKVSMDKIIFKGLSIQGIVGRKLWETWETMGELLRNNSLNLNPIVTHTFHYTEFQVAMELMRAGNAGKVVFTFED